MINTIDRLSTINPWLIIIVIVLVITIIPLAVKTWKELLEALGLISKKEIKEQSDEQRLVKLEERMNSIEKAFEDKKQEIIDNQEKYHQQSIEIRGELANKQDDIFDMLTEMRLEQRDEKIQRMRWQILEVANYIRNKEDVNMEQLNNALDTYDDYEKVLKNNNLNNGQVDVSIQLIREKKLEIMHGDI